MSASFDHVLARGGHSGALIASLDWTSHTLGPIASWPPALKNALSLCLVSKLPSLDEFLAVLGHALRNPLALMRQKLPSNTKR